MAFRDDIKDLFGETPPEYEGMNLRPGQTRRRALDLLDSAPSASPAQQPRTAIPLVDVTSAEDADTEWADFPKAFGAGVVQVGEMGLGAAEYAARQSNVLDGLVADTIYSGRQGLGETREDIVASMTPEAQARLAREVTTLDPDRTLWQGSPLEVASGIGLKFSQALPATLTTLLPAARFFRAASPGKALTYMGATEAGMSVGGIQNGIADEVMGMSAEDLTNESPRFGQLLEENGGNAIEAREALIREAQGAWPVVGGALVGAISAVAGRYLQPLFEAPGAGLASRVGRGFAAEAPQEGSQGATEQLVQNYSARIYDLDRQLSEGVAEAAAQEALIGGTMGGGFAALAGRRPDQPPPPLPDPELDEGGQLTIPGLGPQELVEPDEPDTGEGLDPAEVALRQEQLPLVGGLDIRGGEGRDASQSREFTLPEDEIVPGEDGRPGTLQPRFPVEEEPYVSADAGQLTLPGLGLRETVGEPAAPENDLRNEVWTPSMGVQQDLPMGEGRLPGPGVPAPVIEDPADFTPRQGRLPLTQRQKGRGRVPIGPREEPARPAEGEDENVDETRAVDEGEVARRMDDMLAPEPATPDAPRRGTPGRRELLGYRVTISDTEGNRLDEEFYDNADEAEARADELGQDPELRIVSGPAYETVGATRSEPEAFVNPVGDNPALQPTAEEQALAALRREADFDDRQEATTDVRGVKTTREAAARILARAAKVLAEEDRLRIGGFYSPDRLEFADAEQEARYREAWGRALDSELTVELSQRKREVERAKKRRDAALAELGEVRAVARPKVKKSASTGLVRAAKVLDETGVREFVESRVAEQDTDIGGPRPPRSPIRPVEETDDLGEFEARSREAIDDIATYRVRHKTKSAKNWTVEEFDSAQEAYARQDEIKKRYPKRSVTVDVIGNAELDAEFERAVRFREGREARVSTRKERPQWQIEAEERAQAEDRPAPLTGELDQAPENIDPDTGEIIDDVTEPELDDVQKVGDTIDFRDEYQTPGAKLRFIRREAEARRRQDSGQRKSTAATPVSLPGETIPTQDLTTDKRPFDESVSDRLKREKRAKDARVKLAGSLKSARTLLRSLKTKRFSESLRDAGGNLTDAGLDALFGRQYLQDLIDFASGLMKSKDSSPAVIRALEKLADTLATTKGQSTESFSSKWAKAAKTTRFADLSKIKDPAIKALRDPKQREKATKRNMDRLRRAKAARELFAQFKQNPYFKEFIGPVLAKMAQSQVGITEGSAAAPYIPNEADIAGVEFALRQMWSRDRALYKKVAKVLSEGWGFEIADRPVVDKRGTVGDNFPGRVTFTATDTYLGAAYRKKFGRGAELSPKMQTYSGAIVNNQTDADARVGPGEAATEVADQRRREGVDRWSRYDKVNGLIQAFKDRTASTKTTINGLKRQEDRFIRGLRTLGVWRQIGPTVGQIVLPGGKTKTYRLIGPRLDAKTMRKDAARNQVQSIARVPIPAKVLPEVRRLRQDESWTRGVDRFLTENQQTTLYNPGGFGAEFRALRYPAAVSLVLVLLALGLSSLGQQARTWAMICIIPLTFAGLALVHARAQSRGQGSGWLAVFYLAWLVFDPGTLFVVGFAIADSWFDCRQRWPQPAGTGVSRRPDDDKDERDS